MITIDEDGVIGTPFIRTPYNYNTDQASEETSLYCTDPSKTQQQYAEEVDINTIVERFNASGEMPPTMQFPEQEEFIEAFDFQSAQNVIVKARESFMELPAKARARFENDPQRFMMFMNDPENQDEAIKLGLATKRQEPAKPSIDEPIEGKPPKAET